MMGVGLGGFIGHVQPVKVERSGGGFSGQQQQQIGNIYAKTYGKHSLMNYTNNAIRGVD